MTAVLRRTPLHARHAELGAKLVPFAGWDMPVQYEGVRAEHDAVRTASGVFDVSHMGQIVTKGPGALAALQHLTTNDVSKIAIGGAQYGMILRPDGGIFDDIYTYRLAEDEYLTITNAANHGTDFTWFGHHAQAGAGDLEVELVDAADEYALLAVQGPTARSIVESISDGALPARFRVGRVPVAGKDVLVCGTGYTGEPGVELLIDAADAVVVFDALLEAGVAPIGLAARDTLRLEACYHLYGNDMDAGRNPIEAGLGWAVKEATGHIGHEAVAQARAESTAEVLVPFSLTEGGIPRGGNEIVGGGVVTSGTMSPTLGRGVGLAYLPRERSTVGTAFTVDVRGKHRAAVVEPRPLYQSKEL
ncbi:MAG: glycine cleavage system aminomethyltransferase GcvT [Solirubrobacteraceae bacterium]|nr:glycine cleavage system aminomethyltransferase GcvT [Solirubrobacteraceae bacterium]